MSAFQEGPQGYIQLTSSASFKGYAKVWWETNLVLILTLGVMLPWSLLKRRKYLYQSVHLNLIPFAFTAKAKSMFLGVWIGILLWVLVNFAYEYIPLPSDTFKDYFLYTLVFYVFVSPLFAWFANQALTFRRYYSNFAGINFRFEKNYRECLCCMFGFFLLSPLSLFLLYPYFKWRFFRFRFSRTEFGGVPVHYTAPLKDLYLIYTKFLLICLLPLLILVSPAVVAETIWGDYSADFLELLADEFDLRTLASEYQNIQTLLSFMVVAIMLMLAVPIFLGLTYLRVAVTNLNWAHLSISRVNFFSRAEVSKLLWIRVSNFCIIFLSLGLLIPLAKVRTLRYWTETKYFSGDLERLRLKAKAQQDTSAMGEGVSDIAGLDIGL